MLNILLRGADSTILYISSFIANNSSKPKQSNADSSGVKVSSSKFVMLIANHLQLSSHTVKWEEGK